MARYSEPAGNGPRSPAQQVTACRAGLQPTGFPPERAPESVETHPAPDEILGVTPDTMGYEYCTLPDGSIALYPEDRTVGMVLK
jgi:hypothetical protein